MTTTPETTNSDRQTTNGTIVPLSRPVQAFGEDVREVTLREPNAGDLQACGYPLIIGADRRCASTPRR